MRSRGGADKQIHADDPLLRLPLLVSYIAWETDPKAKPVATKGGPVADPMLTEAVFERCLAAYADTASTAATDADRLSYKDGEGLIWTRYINWIKGTGRPENALLTAHRSVRACPEVALVWCTLLLHMASL